MFSKVFVAASLAALASASPFQKRTYTGPVLQDNFPDPSIIQVGDVWYAFSTASLGVNIPIAKSASGDFNTWSIVEENGKAKDALPKVGSWSTGINTWAPNVIKVGSNYVMYYTAQSQQKNAKGALAECVGVATSADIEGPYQPDNNVLACPASIGGAIDPSGFVDTDGSVWVVYKVDGNSQGNGGECGNTVAPITPTPIMLQRMDSTGTKTDGSQPVIILDRGSADGPLVEAPSLGKVDNTYFLFFSSGCYSSSDYDTSYAVSHSGITANGQNYTKAGYPNAPLLQTNHPAPFYSPGGFAFSADGQHVAFMADANQSTGANLRQLYVGEVTVNAAAGTVSI